MPPKAKQATAQPAQAAAIPKKRGRPLKVVSEAGSSSAAAAAEPAAPAKTGRGRKKKVVAPTNNNNEEAEGVETMDEYLLGRRFMPSTVIYANRIPECIW